MRRSTREKSLRELLEDIARRSTRERKVCVNCQRTLRGGQLGIIYYVCSQYGLVVDHVKEQYCVLCK